MLDFEFMLDTPLSRLRGIGPRLQKKLKKLGIVTCRDLIFHFPHRYEDFSHLVPIGEVKLHQKCCVKGKLLSIENSRTPRKRMILTTALLNDDTGAIQATWFNRPYLTKILKPGDRILLAGTTSLGKEGIYFPNPAYEKISPLEKDEELLHTGRLVPVYPETEGLSSRWLRSLIKPLLKQLENQIGETIPDLIQRQYNILPIRTALWQVHFPSSLELARHAQERFSFQELFYISLVSLQARMRLGKHQAISIPLQLKLMQQFVKTLPFPLTNAQKKSAWQILKDLEKPRPMNRLLEGDVGSGKTVVALMAALNTIKSGYQVVLMAPTEILAKQHFQTAKTLLAPFRVTIGLLTGKTDEYISRKLPNQVVEISRRKLLEMAKENTINFILGTHALIQEKVKFGNLALVILDEQHRFGVEQRAKLLVQRQRLRSRAEKIPHLLSMTATPIPRTLALTIYGDLDLSLLDELPKGRKKIITEIVPPEKRKETYEFIRQQVREGRQVFVICPRIEKSQSQNSTSQISNSKLPWSETKAVKEEYEKLSKEVFPDLRVAMLHGKMPGTEKEKVMKDFQKGKIDILVSTSVVEVGVDIPNATVMMIEGAERFGLAQLHQFRGRVGRAEHQSYCFLFTESSAKKTRSRLNAIKECENGFELAEKDLQIRGPGDFTGIRQWGAPDIVMNSLKDIALVERAREAAKQVLLEDPQLKKYPLLKAEVERLRERVHLE
jgi:ATP-dependent DNA helicase RecG